MLYREKGLEQVTFQLRSEQRGTNSEVSGVCISAKETTKSLRQE